MHPAKSLIIYMLKLRKKGKNDWIRRKYSAIKIFTVPSEAAKAFAAFFKSLQKLEKLSSLALH